MIRILYAASDHANSKIQLSRFLNHIDINKYEIKIAAYKRSSPNTNINWTLDCLYNMFNKKINLDNYYLDIYYKQIKSFSPDLVISDMEYFTTYLSHHLNYEVWQYSSSLIDYALSHKDKYSSQIFGDYSAVLKKRDIDNQISTYMTSNSSRNYVYSYFCDVENRPNLIKGCEWIRPYFVLGENSLVCKHDVVAATTNKSHKLMNFLSKYKDTVLFSDQENNYKNIVYKNLNNEDELACNIKNCELFVSEGHGTFLSDCFYNQKYSIVIPDLLDSECIINSLLSKKYGLCDVIYSADDTFELKDIKLSFNNEASFIHDML